MQHYLDEIKEALHLHNDSAIAKRLRISRQAISKIRNGGGIDAEVAARIAEALGDPKIAAKIMAEKCEDQKSRRVWESLAAAVVLGTAVAVSVPSPTVTHEGGSGQECILC